MAVEITHPEKVLFPDDGITKGYLAAYYEMIATVMLPNVVGRPVTLERYHKGIGEKGIFQKNVVKGFPRWLERVAVPKNDALTMLLSGSIGYTPAASASNDGSSIVLSAGFSTPEPFTFSGANGASIQNTPHAVATPLPP